MHTKGVMDDQVIKELQAGFTWLDPGSWTLTLCTPLPNSGLTASTIAIVPFSYRSTFFTRPMSRYSCKQAKLTAADVQERRVKL